MNIEQKNTDDHIVLKQKNENETAEISQSLAEFAKACQHASFIAIDTEFQREKNYFPKWCLLQLACIDSSGKVYAYIVDAMDTKTDWQLVKQILFEQKLVKVLHAAKQDLEILWNYFSQLPKPIFDTQIAAAILGFGAQCGYERLVRNLLHIEIDKAVQYTDWQARPLSHKQIQYALGDVIYLAQIYPLLHKKLAEQGRATWIDELQKQLLDKKLYENDGSQAWARLASKARDEKSAKALKRLVTWREKRAQQLDKPRQWVCPDDALIELARSRPTKHELIGKVRANGRWLQDRQTLKDIIEQIRISADDTSMPSTKEAPLNTHEKNLINILKAMQRFCAEEHGIATEMLANNQNLNELLREQEKKNNPLLNGWRFEIFGEKALNFLNGNLAISVTKEGKLILQTKTAG